MADQKLPAVPLDPLPLRSRAEQVADHLRACLARGDLREPLPSSREWSQRLGVGHRTLEAALGILAREGVVSVTPRQGVRLTRPPSASAPLVGARVVRWVCKSTQDTSVWAEMYVALSERLSEEDIHLAIERCTAGRLRALRDAGERPDQMLLLASLGERDQHWFGGFGKSALLIDLPAPGVRLPWVWNDAESAIVHAVGHLVARGFPRVVLIMPDDPHGSPVAEPFNEACARAHPPVQADWLRLPQAPDEQHAVAERFADRVRGRVGLVMVYPCPPSILMTALLRRGVDVPGQVELTVVNSMAESAQVSPAPVCYPFPVAALARVIARAARQYFHSGRLPRMAKRIPMQVVFPRSP
jgi:DNA-binding LacI/PurR family transcriptional regulator